MDSLNLLKALLAVLTLAASSSCEHNTSIYFDVKKQVIKSCEEKEIRRIYINNDSVAEVYSIVWEGEGEAPHEVQLSAIDKFYSIYKGWNRVKVEAGKVDLMPFSSYSIENIHPDVSAYKIQVTTNKAGFVDKVFQDSCDIQERK